MNEEELQELAEQLQNPSGELGKIVAQNMSIGNLPMIQHSIDLLQLNAGENILEIGHGGAKHLTNILTKNSDCKYFGVDISPLMHQEAIENNQHYIDQKQADFCLYAGDFLPYDAHHFDKIFTVNTLYFIENLPNFFTDLYRICRPSARVCLTFADAAFMQTLPFTEFGFILRDTKQIIDEATKNGFNFVEISTDNDTVKSKSGEIVNRIFHTLVLEKNS